MDKTDRGRAFRVLSIDGGGMRGLYTAAYLDKLAGAFAVKRSLPALDIGRAFDLVVGTSTGAIISCALAAGVPPAKILSLYKRHGRAVFPQKLPATRGALAREALTLRLLFRSSALARGEAALRRALVETFGDATLGQLYESRGIAVSVAAVEMSQHRAWVFKTAHIASSFRRDDDRTLVDVCMASSAAPLFRSIARIADEANSSEFRYFVDGGLWANNPVLVALVDALQMLATQPGRRLEVFSLGTCPRPEGTFVQANETHWGLLRWRFGATTAQVSLAAQEYAFDSMAQLLAPHIGRPCEIVRFPHGPVPAALNEYLDLDETRPEAIEALIAQAAADVDVTTSACGKESHREGQAIARLFQEMPAREEDRCSIVPMT